MSAYRRESPPPYIPADLQTIGPEISVGEWPFAELSLLLPHWQLDALETAAHGLGLTTAQFLRLIIGKHFANPQPVTPPSGD